MPHKAGKIVIADFKRRSRKGIEFAKQTIKSETIYDQKLREAFDYYLVNWKNYGHPGFFSLACEAVGGNPDSVTPVQASIAMMAAAFDIQDDVIDKSERKHKMPTLYGKFGQEISVLVGNAFLIEGLKLFVNLTSVLPIERGAEAFENLKKRLFEIGNAHALELSFRNSKSTDLNDYLKIFEMKAASVEADFYLGALFGGAGKAVIEITARIGRIVGILMLLREEFIDIFDLEEFSQRMAVHDWPLPIIASMQEEDVKAKILKILSKRKQTKTDIDDLLDITSESKPISETKQYMQLLIEEGITLANKLPKAKLQGTLQTLLLFMLEGL
jgi:geranylgeranyl diphosphate synthase type I